MNRSAVKKNLRKRQKTAIIIALAVIIFLIVALAVARYIVGIFEFEDVDGAKYTVKKQNGVYAIFDEIGVLETTKENGKIYYVTEAGTLVSVDPNGKTSVYAVVDTDDGEAVSVYNRLMMFPKIESSDIKSIKVDNQYGGFTFYRDESNALQIKGYEGTAYDKDLAATLLSICGSTTVMRRISQESVEKYGYEEYGLDKPQASYTITSKGGVTYTVEIGNAIVSNNGHYVRLVGRDSVYMFNSYLGNSVLIPIESYVTPTITAGLTESNYVMVNNFAVMDCEYNGEGEESVENEILFSYWDFKDRENTEYSALPYIMLSEHLQGYTVSSSAVSEALYGIYSPTYLGVKKLGVSSADLEKYGLDKPDKYVYFEIEDSSGTHVKEYIYFSHLTENGTYYATSEIYASVDGKKNYYRLPEYDQIVEIDRSSLPFMEWTSFEWLAEYYFQYSIGVVDTVRFKTNDIDVLFTIKQTEEDLTNVFATVDGKTKEISVSAFKTLYLNMSYGIIFGNTNKSQEELEAIANDPSKFQMTYEVETNVNNLKMDYSFYWLDEIRTYLTVNGKGQFYVLGSRVNKMLEDVVTVANGGTITAISPFADK